MNHLSGLWQLPELCNLLILDEPSRVVGTQPPLGEESNDLGCAMSRVSDALDRRRMEHSLDVAGDTAVNVSRVLQCRQYRGEE